MPLLTQGLLKKLTETPGGPGDEGEVRDLIARSIHPHVDELSIDRMGNLLALKRGDGSSPLQVAVTAHMDEVVLFVTEIDKQGLIHVTRSGGINARTLVGKTVQVGPERLPGVICLRPIHFRNSVKDFETVPDIDDLVIDIGAKDEAAAKSKVKRGQRIAFSTPFRVMGLDALDEDAPLPPTGRISGKAFDDRLGCAVLMELLAGERFPFDLLGIFTVQEEIGVRGALAAGQHVHPDYIFVLEGTVCDDLPGAPGEERYPATRLGDGPALTQRDRSYVVHPRLLQHLLRSAEANGIPCQFKHPGVGGTDARGYGHLSAVPIGIISTPCRYIHGPVAVADLGDLHGSVALLRASLPELIEQ